MRFVGKRVRLYLNWSQPFVANEVFHRPDAVTEVRLTRGMTAIVDSKDYPLIAGYRWTAYMKKGRDTVYAGTGIPSSRTKTGRAVLSMHKLILPNTPRIDHRDGDGLNNRRKNLRPATVSQNGINRKAIPHGSKYHGVNWCKTRKVWYARIKLNGKKIHIGMFDNEEDAYKARLDAEKKYYPDFQRERV